MSFDTYCLVPAGSLTPGALEALFHFSDVLFHWEDPHIPVLSGSDAIDLFKSKMDAEAPHIRFKDSKVPNTAGGWLYRLGDGSAVVGLTGFDIKDLGTFDDALGDIFPGAPCYTPGDLPPPWTAAEFRNCSTSQAHDPDWPTVASHQNAAVGAESLPGSVQLSGPSMFFGVVVLIQPLLLMFVVFGDFTLGVPGRFGLDVGYLFFALILYAFALVMGCALSYKRRRFGLIAAQVILPVLTFLGVGASTSAPPQARNYPPDYRQFLSRPLTDLKSVLDLSKAQYGEFYDYGRLVTTIQLDGIKINCNEAGIILSIQRTK